MTKLRILTVAILLGLVGYANADGISGTMQLTAVMITTALGFTPPSNALTSAHVYVGNGSNVATDVALSQDCTITNAGVVTCLKSNNVAFTASATASAGQLPGTTTNDDASAGKIGEYISSNILIGSQVAVTTATTANVTSVSLTAGDWDCRGEVTFNPAGATVQSSEIGAIGTTSATLPTIPGGGAYSALNVSVAAGVGSSFDVGTVRESLASTTTIYLLAQSTFTVSTNAAYGFLGCRRVR